jgi:hypothetical protein
VNRGAKHTWVFEADSRLLRFYATVWGADPAKANFCSLFWSVVLAPLGLVAFAVIAVGSRLAALISRRKRERVALKDGPGIPARVGEVLSSPKARKIASGALFIGLVVYAVGTCGYWLVLYAIELIKDPWNTLQWTVFCIGCLALVAGAIALLVLLDRRGTLRRGGRFIADGYRSVKSNTCPQIVVRDQRARDPEAMS